MDVDVVIIGGGPTGMAAAVEARLHGAARVLVLEKHGPIRDRSRKVILDDAVMADFARHGLTRDARFNRVDHFHAVIDSVGLNQVFRLQPCRVPGRGSTAGTLLRRSPRQTALISDIEDAYYAAARRLGIEVRFGIEVVGVGGQHGGRPWVEFRPPTPTTSGTPREVERVVARTLGIADGAGSDTLQRLAVPRLRFGRLDQRVMVARFHRSADDRPLNHGLTFHQADDRDGGQLFMACVDDVEIALMVNVPPGCRLDCADEQRGFVEAGARRLGIHGVLNPDSVALFPHTAGLATRLTLGDSVFVLGDAARSTTPFTGLGVNAGVRDAVRFGKAVGRQLAARSPRQIRSARRRYAAASWAAACCLSVLSAFMLQTTRLRVRSAVGPRSASRLPPPRRRWTSRVGAMLVLGVMRGTIRCEPDLSTCSRDT
jgi:2-polyprenyl-6-methoxyphenol hydroxylase-like FAD-dependent oxidoreductase